MRVRGNVGPDSATEPAFHNVYVRVLGAVLARRGIVIGEVSAGLPTTVFGDTDRLPLAPARALIAAAMTATATPWLGLELGAAAQAHTHGLVGTAAFASSTLGEALQTVARFAPLRTQALQFHWQATPSGGELVINARLELDGVRGFVYDAMLVMIERLLQSLSGTSMAAVCYQLPAPRPVWAERYHDHLEGQVVFERIEQLRLQFPAELLARPCLTADAHGYARAAEECTRLLDAHQQQRRIGERVRMLLAASASHFPTAEEVAERLHLSARSLFRHLADEQLSLRQLIADVRCDRARFWLRQTDLPIERIAERLGYAEASNFARCFKRWTGVTPRSYRQSRSACSDLDSAAAR